MILKKLFFAPIFLAFLGLFLFYLQPIINSTGLLFSLNQTMLVDLLILAALLVLSSVSFTIFAAMAQDFKLVVPVILIAAGLPMAFIPFPAAYYVSGGFFISLLPVYFVLEHKLKSYITFSASQLLTPSAKILTTLLVLSTTLGYYLITNAEIRQNGFQVPDQLIDMAIKMSTGALTGPDKTAPSPAVKGIKIAQVPGITQEQIDFLKNNPELLEQYGVDPALLQTVEESSMVLPPGATQTPSSGIQGIPGDVTKNLVKKMLDNSLQPYLQYIAPLLALIFLSTIKFFTSLLELFLPILLTVLFKLLEKSGFIKFITEMREVKKMVV